MNRVRRVFLESPFQSDDPAVKAEYAIYRNACMLDSILRGEAPFASHAMYTQVLEDDIPEQRALGIAIAEAWRDVAVSTVFYIDHGYSPGMRVALNRCISQQHLYVERKLRK